MSKIAEEVILEAVERRAMEIVALPQAERKAHYRTIQVGAKTPDEATGSAGGNRAGLCVPGLGALLQLHRQRNPADHWRILNVLGLWWSAVPFNVSWVAPSFANDWSKQNE